MQLDPDDRSKKYPIRDILFLAIVKKKNGFMRYHLAGMRNVFSHA